MRAIPNGNFTSNLPNLNMNKNYQIAILGDHAHRAVIIEREDRDNAPIKIFPQGQDEVDREILHDDPNYYIIHKLALECEKLSQELES